VPATLPTVTHVVTCDAGDATSYAGCIRQLTVVAELQLDVTHTAPESTDVCVCSPIAKSSPVTVTDAYPLSGVFSSPYDATGPSKLKPSTFVPATVPTVTTIDCSNRWLIVAPIPRALPAKHRRLVDELHDDVSHSTCVYSPELNDDARAPVAVCSPAPNERPDTVTEYPPDIAKFGCSVNEAAGASKLKIGWPVPDTAATVTLALPKMSPKAFERHASVVADIHEEVKHTPRSPEPPRSSAAVAVCS
jgi:hypothetical protein